MNLEQAFVVMALLLFSGAFIPLFRNISGIEFDAETGDHVSQIVFLVIYIVVFGFSLSSRKYLFYASKFCVILWLLVGFAVFSSLWSEVPVTTLRRSFALMGTSFFGLYFGAHFEPEKQFKILQWALALAVVFSLIFGLFLPNLGRHNSGQHAGAWRGIYLQKNYLGRTMVLSAWVFLLAMFTNRRHRWVVKGLFVISLCLLLLSNSTSGLLFFLTLFLACPLYMAFRWGYKLSGLLYSALLLILSFFSMWAIPHLDVILGLFGRDITLTGRTYLWSAMLKVIVLRPYFGYGYGGFWLGWQGPSGDVWASLGWFPLHGHNGFLDVIAQLGIVGLVLFLWGFLLTLRRSINWVYAKKSALGLWPILFLTFVFIYNVSESVILKTNNIFWVLYVDIYVSLTIEKQRPQFRRQVMLKE